MLAFSNMVTSLKHHVFKKMGKAAFTDLFTCTAYMIGHVYIHDRVTMIFVNYNGKAIGQNIFLVRDNDLAPLLFYLFYQFGLAKCCLRDNKQRGDNGN